MLQSITYKTEINEIITLEEVSILFDNIAVKYATSLVSLSLYPDFIKLKKDIIQTTQAQRNSELSCLLSKISDRKQIVKTEMWNILNKLGNHKKELEKNPNTKQDLEQTIYEEEQIVKVYEECIHSLEKKEKKIMSGKYPRINKINTLPRISSLKRQLEDMKNNLLTISKKHDNCFEEYKKRLDNLINKSIITEKDIVPIVKKSTIKETLIIEKPKKFGGIFENIEYIYDKENQNAYYEFNGVSKDFYLYEPNKSNFDDELIYQLLSNGNYDDEDGSVNAILITAEYDGE